MSPQTADSEEVYNAAYERGALDERFGWQSEIERHRRERVLLRGLLAEARCQISYLHEKFRETGSGNTMLARIDAMLADER